MEIIRRDLVGVGETKYYVIRGGNLEYKRDIEERIKDGSINEIRY